MKREVGRKIEMALRVRDFSRSHPFTDPSAAAVLARFEERLTRAEALAVQQRTGQLAAIAANARRNQLRDAPLTTLLRHLARVASEAKDTPELAGKFHLPPQDGSHRAFLTAARQMIKEADSTRDLLISHGMPEAMLADLGQALTHYEAASEAANGAKGQRIGATLDLDTVIKEVVGAVGLLDGINKYRFRDDAESLGAWVNLISVVAPRSKPAAPAVEEGGLKSAA